ncbi:TetR/AcrR family transcriptional regulator [Ilumatobacter coccineus]|jgi:AcrR family transcriptional regulator|uniref:Putative TetR family transcriptional regulator n=1 Tax=Ilumatobacter coccineus (strain NBRC 103263 / KCTC 29153 / YM16-304) TaxID=1313172 RepID=A0A6C7EG22_ILUCY|nr:TetR/AcrR family transcriptional regulator [Ilumatobacter coccineus]BAN03538.1 putative TetR family transcriptional regulator [Ilumatobacter coccineus YM16-304]
MARPTQREVVLDAFQELIVEVGAGNVTLEATAARAGVSKGGLLYHFPSKSDLFAGLVERLAGAIDAAIAKAPADLVELVHWYIDEATEVVAEENTVWLALFAATDAVDDDVAALLGDLFARYSTPLDALPPVLREHVRLVGDGLYFNALIGGPAPSAEHLAQITESLVRNVPPSA